MSRKRRKSGGKKTSETRLLGQVVHVIATPEDLEEFQKRVDEQDARLAVRNTARPNPLGVSWLTLGFVAAAGGGWVYWRMSQRAKLARLLLESATYQEAQAQGLVTWSPSDKASELIGWTNTINADRAYAVVLAELRALLPPAEEDLINLTDDAKRMFEEKTGVDPDAVIAAGSEAAQSVYDKLPDVPGVDTSGWFNSWFGTKGES